MSETKDEGVEFRREGKNLTAQAHGGAARVEAIVFPDGAVYAKKREAEEGEEGERALASIVSALKERCARSGAKVLSLEREADAEWNRRLLDAGFELHRRKIFVRRDLTTLGEVESPFSWKTLAEIGDEEFKGWLAHSSEGDPFEEAEPRDYDREYQELLEYAGERLDRNLWRVALLDGEPVGVVLPQSFGGEPPEGTIFYVGILPAFRGRGLGQRLHRVGLALLAEAGIRRYVGSTDDRNEPMARVFARNGCETVRKQLFFRVP